MTASIAEAFRQGVQGYAQDVFVQGQPWSFPLGLEAMPSIVVHGADDTIVPIAHSQHTAGLVEGATLRTLSGHGHITILAELPGLAADLVGRISRL
jgi:pimeloyl-ACP methyl ester carboxylesterase